MVHPDLFDDVRMPVLRATDRLRPLAPVIDEALRQRYGRPELGRAVAPAGPAGRTVDIGFV